MKPNLPSSPQQLPKVSTAQMRSYASVSRVNEVFEKRFLVRSEEKDYGIDGTVELLRMTEGGELVATNRRAAFQLKHTASKQVLAGGSINYSIEVKNINYLAARPPAFYLLHVQSSNQLFFRWWHDIYSELIRTRPRWTLQNDVTICFRRVVDESVLTEIGIEIDAHTEQVLQLLDGPGLIRNFNAQRLPRDLWPSSSFIGRTDELRDLDSQIIRGSIVPILGPPQSGKTEIVAQYLSKEANLKRLAVKFAGGLALIFIDVKSRIGPRVLRALSYSLGVAKLDSLSEIGADQSRNEELLYLRLMDQVLPARLQQLCPIMVIEGAHVCLEDSREFADLSELMRSNILMNGVALLVAQAHRFPSPGGKCTFQPGLVLSGLSHSESEHLLGNLIGDKALASRVLENFHTYKEMYLPGVIRRGADLFKSRGARMPAIPKDEILSAALVEATGYVIRETLSSLHLDSVAEADGALAPFGVLLIMAMLAELPVRVEALAEAGLPSPNMGSLIEAGWISSDKGVFRLEPSAANVLREMLRGIFTSKTSMTEVSYLEKGLDSFLTVAIRSLSEQHLDVFKSAIEESLSWLRGAVPGCVRLERRLLGALLPHVVDDLVFPLAKDQLADLGRELRSDKHLRLDSCIADLISSARFERDSEKFLRFLTETIDVLISQAQIGEFDLQAVDVAAFIGQYRHRRFADVFYNRNRLIPKLMAAAKRSPKQTGLIKWSISWILNTAALALSLGEMGPASVLARDVSTLFQIMPTPDSRYATTSYAWLRTRMLSLEARIVRDSQRRTEKLNEAAQNGAIALLHSNGEPRWVRFYLRTVTHLVEELRNENEREEVLNAVLECLGNCYGDRKIGQRWPLHVCAQTAALVRHIGALSPDQWDRLRKAEKAIEILHQSEAEAISVAKSGDTRAILVLARCYAFAASCMQATGNSRESKRFSNEAAKWVSLALSVAPSADAWDLRLRLLDQGILEVFDRGWHIDSLAAAKAEVNAELKAGIAACRAWLESIHPWGPEHGRLAIWCHKREWQFQGSLERWAAAELKEADWNELTNTEKRIVLLSKHRSRQKRLFTILKRAGPFPEAFLVLATNESQYRRLLAIYSDHQQNLESARKFLKTAAKFWPDDHMVLLHEARMERLVWNYPTAIEIFRKTVAGTPRSDQRREAAVDLIETLLSCAMHTDRIQISGNTVERFDLLVEAQSLFGEIGNFHNFSGDAAVLRDRVEFEIGKDIDWSALDRVYSTVIGGVGLYANTVMKNLDALREQESGLIERITDFVQQNFTSPDALRGMGSLYLRRGETGRSDETALYCQRAYAIFDSCRLLELAWRGSETATTSYQRARAILVATHVTRNLSPFPADCHGKKDLLHVAEALFQRAGSLSVGDFHLEARKRSSEAARLRSELEKTAVV